MDVPRLELNFPTCIGHSSRNKQQPSNLWVFLYMAHEVNVNIELKTRQRALPSLHPARALIPAMQWPTQAERGHFQVGQHWQWILLFPLYSHSNVM